MAVDLDLQPIKKCADVISEQVEPHLIEEEPSVGLREDSMLCVGVLEGGKDSCQVRSHVRRSVKLLLAFDSTVVPGFTLLETHNQSFILS
jgi:hypothetical protein